MKATSVSLIMSASIVLLVTGLALGFFLSPHYQQTMYDKQEMGLGNADRWVDLRYLNAMITHHKGAIELAKQASEQSERPEIVLLAKDILEGEPKLISKLYDLKKMLYNDTGSAPLPRKVNLSRKDETFDLRFLNALIAHHEEGIRMTKEIRSKSTQTEILNDADRVETYLVNSLVMLKEWRSLWFNVK